MPIAFLFVIFNNNFRIVQIMFIAFNEKQVNFYRFLKFLSVFKFHRTWSRLFRLNV